MTIITKPPTIDDKAFAAVDGEWRTAKDIYQIIGEDAPATTRAALGRLVSAGRIDRRYEPRQNGQIAFYRCKLPVLE